MTEQEKYDRRKRKVMERLVEFSLRSNSGLAQLVTKGLSAQINGRRVLWQGLDYSTRDCEAVCLIDPPQYFLDRFERKAA